MSRASSLKHDEFYQKVDLKQLQDKKFLGLIQSIGASLCSLSLQFF